MYKNLCKCLVIAAAAWTAATAAIASDFETERAVFRDAYPKVRAGNAKALADARRRLGGYTLVTDLEAAFYLARLGKVADTEVADFVERHGDYAIVRKLRRRHALSLSSRGKWDEFLSVYYRHYESADNDEMHCRALTARLADRRVKGLADDALAFWMTGKSRPEECDPVFEFLKDQGVLTTA